MRFNLIPFQADALFEVFDRLRKAKKHWREDSDRYAFSLTATTGAGKTVMAAAAFEGLFFGNEDCDFEADSGAVVIWFSGDPSLNEQSRVKILQASDKLHIGDLITVSEDSFDQEKFEPRKIYFLNTQKLSKTSRLVRGGTDNRRYTIWETIKNTIEDKSLNLYLLLDEAHRGMAEGGGSNGNGRTTIVKQLINGFDTTPPIPIVVGISATVERFNKAMKDAENRGTLPNIVVNPSKVQDSGLLKDTIELDIPDTALPFDTVLVARAAEKIKAKSIAWAEYANEQTDIQPVLPLIILQVPNKPDHTKIGICIDKILMIIPEFTVENIAHVFGEHTTQQFGQYGVKYIKPERVQETTEIRILIAKDAISTGWDCPRAEVMVSFRPALDQTHITQLLGRMTRTPLARRIPAREELNSVDCLLPYFNKETTTKIVEAIKLGEDSSAPILGRRVVVNPESFTPNSKITKNIWVQFEELKTYSLPRQQYKPLKRLSKLAIALNFDGLFEDGVKSVSKKMHKILDGLSAEFSKEVEEACNTILNVKGHTITFDMITRKSSEDTFSVVADSQVIDNAFKHSIYPALAKSYSFYLASSKRKDNPTEEEIEEARILVASLGRVSEIIEKLDKEAERLTKTLLRDHRTSIKGLTDTRRDIYRRLTEMSSEPVEQDLTKPKSWLRETKIRDADGTENEIPVYKFHLLSNEDGDFPAQLNSLEQHVLKAELNKPKIRGWYRNPAWKCDESLGVIYNDGEKSKIMYPDFLFFFENSDGTISANIIDPHSSAYADALSKLKGLAKFAEIHGNSYRRIEAIDAIGSAYKLLDLQKQEVRQAIMKAESAKEIYKSRFAEDYR